MERDPLFICQNMLVSSWNRSYLSKPGITRDYNFVCRRHRYRHASNIHRGLLPRVTCMETCSGQQYSHPRGMQPLLTSQPAKVWHRSLTLSSYEVVSRPSIGAPLYLVSWLCRMITMPMRPLYSGNIVWHIHRLGIQDMLEGYPWLHPVQVQKDC